MFLQTGKEEGFPTSTFVFLRENREIFWLLLDSWFLSLLRSSSCFDSFSPPATDELNVTSTRIQSGHPSYQRSNSSAGVCWCIKILRNVSWRYVATSLTKEEYKKKNTVQLLARLFTKHLVMLLQKKCLLGCLGSPINNVKVDKIWGMTQIWVAYGHVD